MTVSLEQARKAKKILSAKFNQRSAPLINGVGISRNKDGYYVAVRLERNPTAAEKARLPNRQNGVPVKYEVIGTIRPL